jgi:hypothetical protein
LKSLPPIPLRRPRLHEAPPPPTAPVKSLNVRRRRRSHVPRLSPVHCPKDVRSTNVVLSCPGLLVARGAAGLAFSFRGSRCQRRSVWRCFASKACAAPSSSERLALQHRRGRWAMLLFAFPAGPSVQVVLTKVLRVDIGVRRGLSNRLISETAASSSARRPPCSASPAP